MNCNVVISRKRIVLFFLINVWWVLPNMQNMQNMQNLQNLQNMQTFAQNWNRNRRQVDQ
jgi:hypothetical protein